MHRIYLARRVWHTIPIVGWCRLDNALWISTLTTRSTSRLIHIFTIVCVLNVGLDENGTTNLGAEELVGHRLIPVFAKNPPRIFQHH